MSLKKLIEKAPYIIGVTDPERWSELISEVFDKEIKNPNSAFARKKDDELFPHKRILCISTFPDGNKEKIKYYKDLLTLAMFSSYKEKESKEKGEAVEQYDSVIAYTTEQLVNNPQPEIEEVYSVEAATRGFWN